MLAYGPIVSPPFDTAPFGVKTVAELDLPAFVITQLGTDDQFVELAKSTEYLGPLAALHQRQGD